MLEDSSFNPQKRSTNYVKFYYRPKPSKEVDEFGFPKDVLKEYVKIVSPGQSNTEVDRPVQEKDRAEYREQYMAFKSGQETHPDGTLIEHAPFIQSNSLVDKLKSLSIFTVEQLAELSDGNLANVGIGALKLRAAAQAYLENAPSEADKKVVELEEKVAKLTAMLEAKPKTTRKRKVNGST